MRTCAVIAPLALLGGCALPSIRPTVAVLPAPGKPFDRFAEEDSYCRDYAGQQVALAPEQLNSQLIGSAVIGTLLGAG
jgi:hypothetical protein